MSLESDPQPITAQVVIHTGKAGIEITRPKRITNGK